MEMICKVLGHIFVKKDRELRVPLNTHYCMRCGYEKLADKFVDVPTWMNYGHKMGWDKYYHCDCKKHDGEQN